MVGSSSNYSSMPDSGFDWVNKFYDADAAKPDTVLLSPQMLKIVKDMCIFDDKPHECSFSRQMKNYGVRQL